MSYPNRRTIDELLANLRQDRAAVVARHKRATAACNEIVDRAKREGREFATGAEDDRLMTLDAERREAKAVISDLDKQIATAQEIADEERTYARRSQQTFPDPFVARARAGVALEDDMSNSEHGRLTLSAGAAFQRAHAERTNRGVGGARVGGAPRVYRQDEDPTGKRFLADVASAFRGDYAAGNRLGRHIEEEKVDRAHDRGYLTRAAGDAGTGNFVGLTVPQYLTDMYAPLARGLRPFADNCAAHDLPAEGMSLNISKITTGTSVAIQASELTTVASQSIDDTLLAINVQTAAGSQNMSRQAIERGTGAEEVTLQDLFRAHATALDSTLLNQATTGLAAVSALQAYTNATVDTTAIPAVWKALIQAQNSVEGVLLGQAPVSAIVMNNRRWNWLCAAISSSWPVIAGTNVPPQSWGMQLSDTYGPTVRGVTASGLKIIVDSNVTTAGLAQATTGGTQDQVYVVALDECHLWEDPNAPTYIRAEQPNAANLGVLMVVYSYFAYTFARYTNGSVVVAGTGFAPPSFA